MAFKIGELSTLTDTKIPTIRYYEKEGLLDKPLRTEGNYRVYGEKDVHQLKFIRYCRKGGIGLGEIRRLLREGDDTDCCCSWVHEMMRAHLREVEEQMAALRETKGHLEFLLGRCAGDEATASCGIVKSLNDAEVCQNCPQPRLPASHGAGQKTPEKREPETRVRDDGYFSPGRVRRPHRLPRSSAKRYARHI